MPLTVVDLNSPGLSSEIFLAIHAYKALKGFTVQERVKGRTAYKRFWALCFAKGLSQNN